VVFLEKELKGIKDRFNIPRATSSAGEQEAKVQVSPPPESEVLLDSVMASTSSETSGASLLQKVRLIEKQKSQLVLEKAVRSMSTVNVPPDDDTSMDVDMDVLDQPLIPNSKKLTQLEKIAGCVNPFKGTNKGSAGYRFRKNGGSRRGGRPFR